MLEELTRRLQYDFRNPDLLRLALTHPSAAAGEPQPVPSNQRLEFLGDSVLQLVISRELYDKYPGVDEGALTKARARMVNRRTLADQARRLDLGRFLTLSRAEQINGGADRPSSLADAFEALVGAIFLDGGFAVVQQFILGQFHNAFGESKVIPNLDNPKGELQEILQSRSAEPPVYSVASTTGPDHQRVYECTVHHQGAELGRGVGGSKKAAEEHAARAALQTLRQNPA
ncbi:MAG TPA: ribonuclease III [Candidatus Paceibacterota bacterium]|nr:ribonuclease III [Verrucomicrobiota bacterium]HRZ46493.1 ribonuclease III [Candidatus Paceibacterota bacterium]